MYGYVPTVELNLKQEIHFRTTSVINTESQLGKNVNNVKTFRDSCELQKHKRAIHDKPDLSKNNVRSRSQRNQETLSDGLITIKRLRIEHA